MQVLTDLLGALGSVFTTYVPALGAAIYNLFISVFTTSGTALNSLGYVAVGFIGIGIVSGLVATVLGILRIKRKKGGKRKMAKAR